MTRKAILFALLLCLIISSGSFAYSISRDWQQTLNASSTVAIDRIQVYLAEGKDSAGVDINEFQLTPYGLRLANNTKVWVPGTTTQTDWYDAGSGYAPVATYWGVPNTSGLTATTTTNNPTTGLPVTYVEPMQNWVSADKKIAVIEAPSYILGTFLGIREYWKGTVAPAQAYQATVYYQFYKAGILVTSATYSKPAGSTSWTKTVTGTSSAWNQGYINIGTTYTITASAGAGGTISPTGSVSVNPGANQSFTITPNAGYSVSQVTVDGVNQGAITSYTFSNVTANHTISATFSNVNYTITASAGSNGSINPSGSVSAAYGTNQTFTITPNAGYQVAQVTVDGANQGAITSYTFSNVTANHTISATFAAVPSYTLTASAGAGGTISPSGATTVVSGANQTYSISANSGYSISQVVVDGVNQGAITSYTFSNVTANHTISATFAAIPSYTLTSSAGAGGTISPSGTTIVVSGANQTYSISANSGYSISQVVVDGVNQGAISSYTFSNITANHSISASFAANSSATKLLDITAGSLVGNDGDAVSSWTNAGTLGGVFGLDGTDQTTRPVISTIQGRRCVTFDGSNDRLKLVNGGTAITAPSTLTGNSDWTVTAWIYNPSISSTEAYLCWASSAEVAPGRCGFLYGYHNGDGATQHGSVSGGTNYNMPFKPVPAPGVWHMVAVTFDGTVEKVYLDGVLNQTESKTLTVAAGHPIMLGCLFGTPTGGSTGTRFSGSIAALSVYDQALTATDINNLSNVTVSGKVTGPAGADLAGAVVGFKNVNRGSSATADADVYAVADASGNYTANLLAGNTYYAAAWKDGYTPGNDSTVVADSNKTVNLSVTAAAGYNLAYSRTVESDTVYASATGFGTYPANLGFDGSSATYFSWNTSSQKDLVIDVTRPDGTGDSINGVTLITNNYRAYDWEIWVESNADPIVAGTVNSGASWTRIYQSIGGYGGYYRTSPAIQVLDPVKFSATTARGIWIKILNSTFADDNDVRPYEVMVHSSASVSSIASAKAQADGTTIFIDGNYAVWSPRYGDGVRMTNYFYVEDAAKTAGIRVVDPTGKIDSVKVNDEVSVIGTMQTDSNTGERYLNATLLPTCLTSSGISQADSATTYSVQNTAALVGKLVSVSNCVVAQVAADGSWFTVTDNSNGSVQTKVYVMGVQLPANLASVGDTINLIGAVAKEYSSGTVKSVIMLYNYSKPAGTSDEFTFFTISDIHYGAGVADTSAKTVIDVMNSLPGTAYPAALGGFVQTPKGVIEIGDVADGGTAAQFDVFAADYGINAEGRLRYPVFEGLGNHDQKIGNPVSLKIMERNPFRRDLTGLSSNGMHYSWDWNNVHFVQLNRIPADVTEPNDSNAMVGDQCYALSFLQSDLSANVAATGKRVFIVHHYGFEEFSSGWWSPNERTLYWNALSGYDVIGIAHGHKHSPGKYQWNGTSYGPTVPNGIDVYQDGSGYNIESACPGSFYVYRVRNNELSFAQVYYNPTSQQWEWGLYGTKSL